MHFFVLPEAVSARSLKAEFMKGGVPPEKVKVSSLGEVPARASRKYRSYRATT